ncbi:hypothetical protein F4777DRAFT_554640 [Nemania sp. FL0916]|nr:hypothetical protein F4777DRAFT_554640 [Nemania sp. FL0916]
MSTVVEIYANGINDVVCTNGINNIDDTNGASDVNGIDKVPHVNGFNGVGELNGANGIHRSTSHWRPTRDEVIKGMEREKEAALTRPLWENFRGFRLDPPATISAPPVWVKFADSPESLLGEMNTQRHVHAELMDADEDTRARFHVPEPYDFFEADIDGWPHGMLVMEYLPGTSIRELIMPLRWSGVEAADDRITSLKDRVIDAVCFLLSVRAPPDTITAPGPVGGGHILNRVFGMDDPLAPQEFDSLEELQTYINEGNEKEDPDLPPADFLSEGLRLCCCDLGLHNFILEDVDNPSSTRLIIIDFELTNFLPYSFLVWGTWSSRDPYLSEQVRIRGKLVVNEDNMAALNKLHSRREREDREFWARVSRAVDEAPSPREETEVGTH